MRKKVYLYLNSLNILCVASDCLGSNNTVNLIRQGWGWNSIKAREDYVGPGTLQVVKVTLKHLVSYMLKLKTAVEKNHHYISIVTLDMV